MATRQEYINRINKGKEIYAAIDDLKDGQSLVIKYNDNEYHIRMFEMTLSSGRVSRASIIADSDMFGKQMNVDLEKSGKSFLYCYTFDLFNNHISAKLYFDQIEIIEKQ